MPMDEGDRGLTAPVPDGRMQDMTDLTDEERAELDEILLSRFEGHFLAIESDADREPVLAGLRAVAREVWGWGYRDGRRESTEGDDFPPFKNPFA